jgi:hypothetical protein
MDKATRRRLDRLTELVTAEGAEESKRLVTYLKGVLTPAELRVLSAAWREQAAHGDVEWTPELRPVALKVMRDRRAMAIWDRMRDIIVALDGHDPGPLLRIRISPTPRRPKRRA